MGGERISIWALATRLTCRRQVDILMATIDGLAEVAFRPDARAIKGKPGYRQGGSPVLSRNCRSAILTRVDGRARIPTSARR